MRRIGATKLYDPDRLAIVLDHVSPAKTEKYAKDQQTSRNFARDYGIGKFYDVDAGIAHLVLMENGQRNDGDQHQQAAQLREKEKLCCGVDPPFVAPYAAQEVHRHEHQLPEQIEDEQVRSQEHAGYACQHPKHVEVEETHSLPDLRPRGKNGRDA